MIGLIRRVDAVQAVIASTGAMDAVSNINAIPAAQGSDPAKIRADALREAAALAFAQEDGDRWTRATIQAAILDMIGGDA